MKLVMAEICGLKGIYAKSGKDIVIIDFRKCKHNVVYIIGPNGSGKTTLLSALSPLPDPPSIFMDGKLGSKMLVYEDSGIQYQIYIQYPLNGNGTRATTKAYFKETDINGNGIELNPNGNIGSYKEVLFSKFNLDPNFMSLSYLSSESKGIVEKRPSERKKIVADLLESIEVYNEMYKTFNKRSTTFKAMINSIASKIGGMGNEEELIANKINIDNRILTLEQNLTQIDADIASSTAAIKLIDPDGAIQETHRKLFDRLQELENALKLIVVDSSDDRDSVLIDVIMGQYKETNETIIEIKTRISEAQANIADMLLHREEEAKRLNIKTEKFKAMTDTHNIDEIHKSIQEYKARIKEYMTFFNSIGLDPITISKDEYIYGIQCQKELQDAVLYVRSYASAQDIIEACEYLMSGENIIESINDIQTSIDADSETLSKLQESMRHYEHLVNQAEILSKRPDTCDINTCPFIKTALEAKREVSGININGIMSQINNGEKHLKTNKEQLSHLNDVSIIMNDLKNIERTIRNNTILKKLPNGAMFNNPIDFFERVKSGDRFDDISRLYECINRANVVELYKNDSAVLQSLSNEYANMIKVADTLSDSIEKDIQELRDNLASIDDDIANRNTVLQSMVKEVEKLTIKLDELNMRIARVKKIEELNQSKAEIESQLRVVSENINKISAEVGKINSLQSRRIAITSELGPLKQTKSNIEYSLGRLAEYKAELSTYEQQYQTIELLKKYSSPTKGGIQTIFMQLYMNKTLTLANQLLSKMFGGKITLMDYVINENEFRIPCRNNLTNLIADDVCNCSTSERCMIGMILGFAMMHQSSPVYNIIKLDEINSGLDQLNRAMFPDILDEIMHILEIEMCIMVSHASEAVMTNADVISLAPVSHERVLGNVIFEL